MRTLHVQGAPILSYRHVAPDLCLNLKCTLHIEFSNYSRFRSSFSIIIFVSLWVPCDSVTNTPKQNSQNLLFYVQISSPTYLLAGVHKVFHKSRSNLTILCLRMVTWRQVPDWESTDIRLHRYCCCFISQIGSYILPMAGKSCWSRDVSHTVKRAGAPTLVSVFPANVRYELYLQSCH